MIKNLEHAIFVQRRRFFNGKRGVAKAVRRFVMREYGGPIAVLPHINCHMLSNFIDCTGEWQGTRALRRSRRS